MTRAELLSKSEAMMSESGELFANPACGRGAEVFAYDREWANELTRNVVRWLRVFRFGRHRGYFKTGQA
jgi:hypothetical protein